MLTLKKNWFDKAYTLRNTFTLIISRVCSNTMSVKKKAYVVEYNNKMCRINRPSDLNSPNDPKHRQHTGFVYTCGDSNCSEFCLSKRQYDSILRHLQRKEKGEVVTLRKINSSIWMQFTMPTITVDQPCLMCLKHHREKIRKAVCVADAVSQLKKKKSTKKKIIPKDDILVSEKKQNTISCDYLVCSENLCSDSCGKKHSKEHLEAYQQFNHLYEIVKQGKRLEWSKIHTIRLSLTLFKDMYNVTTLENILMLVKNQLDGNMLSTKKSGTISTKLSEQLKTNLKAFLDNVKDYSPQKKAPPGFQLMDFVVMKPAQKEVETKEQYNNKKLKEDRDTLRHQVYELEGHVSYLNDRIRNLDTTKEIYENELDSLYTKVDTQEKTIKAKEDEIRHLYARLAQFQNEVNWGNIVTASCPNAWTTNNGHLADNFIV